MTLNKRFKYTSLTDLSIGGVLGDLRHEQPWARLLGEAPTDREDFFVNVFSFL